MSRWWVNRSSSAVVILAFEHAGRFSEGEIGGDDNGGALKLLAEQHEGIEADVKLLGKALSGGFTHIGSSFEQCCARYN